eukprot:gene14148-15625_t
MLKVVLFLLFIQQGCSSPLWKHGGLAEPGELSMDETRVLNNKEGQRTGQLPSTRVRTRQRVADEQINSRRLVFENVGRFGTATLTENMEAPTRKPKQTPRTTQKPHATVVVTLVMLGLLILLLAVIGLYLKRNPRLAAWLWKRNKKGYMPLKVKIKNRKKKQHLRKGNKNRDSVPGQSGFHASNESSRSELNRLEDGTRKQSSKGTEWSPGHNINKSGIKDHGNEQCEVESHVLPDGGKKLLTSNGDRDVERNVQRESTHAMQGKDRADSRTSSLIHAGIRTSDTDTDVSDGEEYQKPGSAVWNSSVHLVNRFKESLSGLLINGKPERLREIASLPLLDTESEEDVDEIVLCDQNSKQSLLSSSNDEPELVEPEVLIKQIYVKKDSLVTNSSDSASEWKLKMNLKQSLTAELASLSADTGIDCDSSVDANLNKPLRANSKHFSNTWVDAASVTTYFQISKQNREHSRLAEPIKECRIDIQLNADECDAQFHGKERGTKDALQERSIEDACAKNGAKDVASTDKAKNECGNKKNAFNVADVYEEVPKDEECEDSDVESDTSSIEISDIDSEDEGSLWEVSSLSSSDSFVTSKPQLTTKKIPSPDPRLCSPRSPSLATRSGDSFALDNDDEIFGKHGSVEYIIRRYVGDTASATTRAKAEGAQGLVESGVVCYEHPTEQSDFSVLDAADSVTSNKGITIFGQESKVTIPCSSAEGSKAKKKKRGFFRRIFGKSMCVRGMD